MTEEQKQIYYRDARSTKQYDQIWQSVGKCVFCDLREKYIVLEERGIVLTVSLYAYIDGHLLIMPRRHVRSPRELSQGEWDTIRKFTYIAKKIIRDVHGVKGMQVVQKDGADAQSTVDQHLHFHCIPFDAPDLCQWNYRKLQHTPLQNAGLYKKARKKIIEHDLKYDQKYRNLTALPVSCNLLIVNRQKQILFQERAEGTKLSPDVITIPGGMVDDFTKTLEAELAREVLEETGWQPPTQKVKLIASRIAHIKAAAHSPHLRVKYPLNRDFIWNVYLYQDFDESTPLTPGDDCKALVWVDIKNIAKHPRISPGTKQIITGLHL